MNCYHCKHAITNEDEAIPIGCDGDFVCNEVCLENYNKDRDSFFDNIVQSEKRISAWLHGASVSDILSIPEVDPRTHKEKIIARLEAIQRS